MRRCRKSKRGIFSGEAGTRHTRDLYAAMTASLNQAQDDLSLSRRIDNPELIYPRVKFSHFQDWYSLNQALAYTIRRKKNQTQWQAYPLSICSERVELVCTRLRSGEIVAFPIPHAFNGVCDVRSGHLRGAQGIAYLLSRLVPGLKKPPERDNLMTVFRDIPAKYALVIPAADVTLYSLQLSMIEPWENLMD